MQNIHRLLLDKLKKGFKNNRVIIIIGSRQVGKTTLMKMHETCVPNSFNKFYFNLEDSTHLSICQNIDSLTSYLSDNSIDIKKNKVFLIIDEFHYIKKATNLFKLIYDLYPNVCILASGSSSVEIQKHLKESLAGRKRVYNLYTLTFEEFILFKDNEECNRYKKLGYLHTSKQMIEKYNKEYMNDYLTYGGYPKVTLLKNKIERIEELQDIYNSYIQKDIKSLIKGEDIASYNNLLTVLASQIGNLLNIHELSNTLQLGRRLVKKYLNILEQTFVIRLLKPFHHNKRTEISKMPKLYMLDHGITNFATNNFSAVNLRPNIGAYIENFIFNEIVKYKPIHYEIYFWRTKLGTGIDFILQGNDEIIPIEVKWQSIEKPIIPKSFISFFNTFKNIKRAVIVTRSHTLSVHKEGKKIYYIPAVLFNKFIKELK